MGKPIAQIVDEALKAAGIPIDGVSIGQKADRSTWSVHYGSGATKAQQVAGDALLASVDVSPQPDPVVVDPLTQALFEAIPNPKTTLAQLQARAQALQIP